MIPASFNVLAREIKKLGDVLITSDNDLDGITSAKLMKVILDKLGIKNSVTFREHEESFDELFARLKNTESKEIILLDTPMPDNLLIKLAEDKKVIYIDHHKKALPEQIPDNLTYFDYRAIRGRDIATSILTYKLGKRLIENFEKYSLIAVIGAIGDFSYDRELFTDFTNIYKSLYNKYYLTFPIYDLAKILAGFEPEKFMETNIDNLLDMLQNNRKEIIKNLNNLYKTLLNFKVIKKTENIMVLECKKPSITTTFFYPFYPDKVIVGYAYKKKFWILRSNLIKVSLRSSRDDLDLGDIAREFTNTYGISGGGHKNAAGMLTKKENLEKLIRFIESKIGS